MIYFNINIRNPWWTDRYANLWYKIGKTPLKNKYWEMQSIKTDNILRLEFSFTVREDHAGLNLEIGLLGYEIHFTLYDNRHWNYKLGTWQKYGD